MAESIAHMLIGAGGTVLYLWTWSRALHRCRPDPATQDERQVRRRRRHTRLFQIFFFLMLTPYVLLLYYFMDRVSAP